MRWYHALAAARSSTLYTTVRSPRNMGASLGFGFGRGLRRRRVRVRHLPREARERRGGLTQRVGIHLVERVRARVVHVEVVAIVDAQPDEEDALLFERADVRAAAVLHHGE